MSLSLRNIAIAISLCTVNSATYAHGSRSDEISRLTPAYVVNRLISSSLIVTGFRFLDNAPIKTGDTFTLEIGESYSITVYLKFEGRERADFVFLTYGGYIVGRGDLTQDSLCVGAVIVKTVRFRLPYADYLLGPKEDSIGITIGGVKKMMLSLETELFKAQVSGKYHQRKPSRVLDKLQVKGNLLDDPGFEERKPWVVEAGMPLVWYEGGRGFYDSKMAYSGNRSLCFDFWLANRIYFYARLFEAFVKPGDIYRLGFHYKASYLYESDSLPYVYIFNTPPLEASLLYYTISLTGTSGWQKRELQFKIPESVSSISIQLARIGSVDPLNYKTNDLSGTLWLDDFYLIEAGKGNGK